MPSGRTHDRVTYALASPVFVVAQIYGGDLLLSGMIAMAMVFAGLMFGPDLDLQSKQYQRWGPLRFIWYPYRLMTGHRSRLSHGLILSTPVRILYFSVVVIVCSTTALYAQRYYLYGNQTTWMAAFNQISADLIAFWQKADKRYLWAAFAGLWLGAAIHTLTDVLGSIAKQLRQML
jgi:uncharacterized metal-binding protein